MTTLRYVFAIAVTAGCVIPAPRNAAAQQPAAAVAEAPEAQVVRAQVASFNSKDVPALTARIAPDFVWYNVTRDSLTVEARGREDFEKGMKVYFMGLPNVTSEISGVAVSGAFVSFRELVSWTTATGVKRSQSSIGVYEVRNGLIVRSWYYPEHRE